LNQVVLQLRTLVGGGSEHRAVPVSTAHRRPAPVTPVHKHSLSALKTAVARPKTNVRAEAVATGKPDRSSFPLEDDFTEM
jgi:hypothetical protein